MGKPSGPKDRMIAALAERGITTTTSKIDGLRSPQRLVPLFDGDPQPELVDWYQSAIELTGQGKRRDGVAAALAVRGFDLDATTVREDMRRVMPEFFALEELRALPDLSTGASYHDWDTVESLTQDVKARLHREPKHPLAEVLNAVPANLMGAEDRRSSMLSDVVTTLLGDQTLSQSDLEEHAEVYGHVARKRGLTDTADTGGGMPQYATVRKIIDVIETLPITTLLIRARRIRPALAVLFRHIAEPVALDVVILRFAVALSAIEEEYIESAVRGLELLGLDITVSEALRATLPSAPASA